MQTPASLTDGSPDTHACHSRGNKPPRVKGAWEGGKIIRTKYHSRTRGFAIITKERAKKKDTVKLGTCPSYLIVGLSQAMQEPSAPVTQSEFG